MASETSTPRKPILLIWEAVPESTKMFWFDDLDLETWNMFIKAHNTHIGMHVNDIADEEADKAADSVNRFLWDDEKKGYRFDPIYDSDGPAEPPSEIPCGCVIVVSGFIM